MASGKILLITGVSSGFGRALAREALAAGHKVVGTVRSAQAKRDFESLSANAAFGRVLDVTDFDAIDGIVAEIEATVGPVDVLVNNAGYGHEGVMEESPLSEMRRQFDVNVFGAVAMMKAVLPLMRERRRGHILNITSMGGYITMPGITYYCGSKFALEGISEALGKEVKPFGIAVTAVAPGSFRTDWAGRSMTRTPRSITTMSSTPSAKLVRRRAASNWEIRKRRHARCSPQSPRTALPRIFCSVAMHSGS
jgi:NAD(P)-dependent dehydrogenase (short-subunit alcohol dehydrogenase family)